MSSRGSVVRVVAATVDEARREASRKLGVAPSLLEAEVVGARKTGLLGFGAPKLEVLVWEPMDESQVDGSETPAAAPTSELPRRPEAERTAGQAPWEVFCRGGECFLKVHRTGPWLAGIEDRIRPWPLDDYQREAVREAVADASGRAVRIGRITPPEQANLEAPAFVKIADDGMSAWLAPASGAPASADELFDLLAAAGVEWGINEEAVAALAGRELTEPVLAARGTESTPSRDAAVEYLFSENDDGEALHPRLREDGSVDHRDLRPMYTVPPGTIVGRYIPAVSGQPGRDVFGREREPAKPGLETPAERFAGRDVRVAENGIDLVATRAGRPVRQNARIDIVEVYTVEGDVDYSTGNVDFNGDVYVMGDVQPGFAVRASGDVRIDGTVDAANIDAGRDLVIAGGIYGHGESSIRVGRSMTARFIDSAEVTCGGSMTILSTIIRSTVTCTGRVTLMGRGTIVGGKVKAVAGISCTAAGSAAGVPTSLELDWLSSVPPGPERERELARYRAARITLYGDVYPGTTVTINGAKFPVRDRLRGVAFQAADRGIALSPAR
jgi:predicted RNA-binding protein Jag